MLVLGVADGPEASAALVKDDELVAWVSQSRLDGEHRSVGLPWGAMDAALAEAGVERGDVDFVAVAGRFSPPLMLRRRPWLRKAVGSPFSPWHDVQVFWQAVLRHSGLGAYEADVAAEWLEGLFNKRGFEPWRLRTVDIHQALAEAAYRLQPEDDAVIIGVHPMGDGVALAVHTANGGQLDRTWVQRGFASLHVHWMRAIAAMGLRPGIDDRRLALLALEGSRDATLDRLLAQHLHAEGPRMSRTAFPRVGVDRDAVYDRIRELSPADAAASVYENMRSTICDVVRYHVRRGGKGCVALAGEVFELPRMVAAVAAIEEVDSVSVLPSPGRGALALGAAAHHAGLAPHQPNLLLGPTLSDERVSRALARAGVRSVRKAGLPNVLFSGGAVVRFRGRPGPGPIGMGERCVMVRADDAEAIARVRARLGLPDDITPTVLAIPTLNESWTDEMETLRGPLSWGAAAPMADAAFKRRYGPSVASDGRVTLQRVEKERQPSLHRVLEAFLRASGCGALAAFPLAEGDAPAVAEPEHAIEVWRRAGFEAMQIGAHYVEQGA